MGRKMIEECYSQIKEASSVTQFFDCPFIFLIVIILIIAFFLYISKRN